MSDQLKHRMSRGLLFFVCSLQLCSAPYNFARLHHKHQLNQHQGESLATTIPSVDTPDGKKNVIRAGSRSLRKEQKLDCPTNPQTSFNNRGTVQAGQTTNCKAKTGYLFFLPRAGWNMKHHCDRARNNENNLTRNHGLPRSKLTTQKKTAQARYQNHPNSNATFVSPFTCNKEA
ncbi:MAG: hypothetical protein BYD32DRAFT_198926 [Podila humilis]|nr:MAG: hypothetical protein BYD32DRAFT_198926 [Podila humilis]